MLGERWVGQLVLCVDVQFVSERRATWCQPWGGGATWGNSSASLRRHTVLTLTWRRGSVSQKSSS